MNQTNQIVQIDTVIDSLKNQMDILKAQIDILIKTRNELSGENKSIESIATTYHCSTCNKTFDSKAKYDRHLLTKTHIKATGQTGVKCSRCNNTYYGKDLHTHTEDGRCSKSRTCNGCNVVFDNVMRKSRHKCCEKYGKKNCKITKCVPAEPLDTPKEIIKEILVEPTKEITKVKEITKPVPEKKVSTSFGFALPDKGYELNPLPEYCEVVNEAWFLGLHRPMNENRPDPKYPHHECWEGVTKRATRFFGDEDQMEDFPMYSKGNTIYYVDEDEPAFEIIDKGYYYDLISKYVDEEAEQTQKEYESKFENVKKIYEEVEEVEDKFLNPLIESEADFNVESYINLHKVEPESKQFRDNCLDIKDCEQQGGDYMYYSNGYLMRNDEALFHIVKNSNGTMYDLIAIEQNESDNYDTDSSVNSSVVSEI